MKARIQGVRSPRILHLATHGFFLQHQRAQTTPRNAIARLAQVANPLLRSGLALAGANSWLEGRPLPAEAGNGLLTGEDAAALDLLGTEVVVLSACDTGIGETDIGEGVFGLRRALLVAGARTLVMSVWKVPDRETRELMEAFYGALRRGESRVQALREAQLSIRSKHAHPLFWGGFICQGDPSPLS